MKKLGKKGMGLGDLAPIAIAFVFVTIVIGIGADVLSTIEADQAAGSFSENASLSGLEAIDELGSWLPTVALVVAAAVVIGILALFRS